MRRAVVVLAAGWAAAGAARGQPAPGGYVYAVQRYGYHFRYGGPGWEVSGYRSGWAVVPVPVWPDRPAPPPAIPVIPPDPPPDPRAAVRVDAAVRRGDLLVIRPNGPGLPPLPPPRPPDPPPVVNVPPAVDPVPNDPRQRAVFEVGKARAAFAAGEYGRAAERLLAAVAANPDDPLPYFLLSQARTARGEYPEAVAAIRDGMQRAPDWPASGFRLRELYGDNGRAFDAHLADLRKAADGDPADPTVGFLLGYHLWFSGERAEAVKRFRKAAGQVRDPAVVERFLAEAEGGKA